MSDTEEVADEVKSDSSTSDYSLDGFSTESESSDESISEEIVRYYHEAGMKSPDTKNNTFNDQIGDTGTFLTGTSLTTTTTTTQIDDLKTSLSPSQQDPKKKKKKKKKRDKHEDIVEGLQSPQGRHQKEQLTNIQVRKYFGTEARETFHKKVNWLCKQGAVSEGAKPTTTDMTALNNKTQIKRARKVKRVNAANSSHARSELRSVSETSASSTRRHPKLRQKRNSYQSMFFDDTSDLDAAVYTNALEGDGEVDLLSTKEFIQLSQKERKNRTRNEMKSSIPHKGKQMNSTLLDFASNRPDGVMSKIDSIRASTPDLHTLPSEGKGLTKIDSPRSKYIVGCLANKMNPRASLLIRKDLTHEFQLAGMGMGDKMAIEFANSIKTIPVVHRINIDDNNLTDKGMKAILESIVTLPNLLELNMSNNKMGVKTAKALQAYLCNQNSCKLTKLILRNADVDDFEGDMFVTALKGNAHLKELDLSQNLIGQSEMVVRFSSKRGDRTATKAVAEHLSDPSCCLEILKLSWNSIRLGSGVSLAKAIALNQSLRILDLSYNAIGSDGGKIIGESIFENKTMEILTLASNNIDGEACFVICAATEHNCTLRQLCLDGNPIGEMGAKSIMNIPCIIGSRLEISCLGCNTGVRQKVGSFDEMEPFGLYDLDMTIPYQRAVACRLLSIVCCNSTYRFPVCIYSESPIRGTEPPLQLHQHFVRERILHASKKEKKTIKMLHRLRIAANDIEKAKEIFNEFDIDHSGEIDKHEFMALLQAIGIPTSESIIDKCMFLVDVDGSGMIEIDELIAFFKASAKDAETKINDLIQTNAMCVVNKSGEFVRYVPPTTGYMRIHLENGQSRKTNFQVITGSDQINIIKLANKLGDVTTMIRYALQHTKLRIQEAINFYDVMLLDNGDKTRIMHYLLPRMLLPAEAQQLISHVTLEHPRDIAFLRQSMGNAIRPILGTPCGYYTLDLTKDMDRVCLHRLMEISATANLFKIEEKSNVYTKGCFCDTSSHGNFSFFRNETLNGEKTVINPANFVPLPSRGLLEFDYSGDFRPLLSQHKNTISDNKCTKVLINLALKSIFDKDKILAMLREMKRSSLPIATIDGCDRYSTEFSKRKLKVASEIQEAQIQFYSNLNTRQEHIRAKQRSEEIKVDYSEKTTELQQLSREQSNLNGENGTTVHNPRGRRRMLPRMLSVTMEDPFMQQDDSPSEFTDKGIIEVNTAASEDNADSENADTDTNTNQSRAGLLSMQKVIYIESAQEASGRVQLAKNALAASLVTSGLTGNETVTREKKRTDRRRALKRVDSRFLAGVTKNRRKLRELISTDSIHPGAKIKKLLSCLIEAVGNFWLESRHVAIMLHVFPLAEYDVVHTFGSYKVELVVMLFSRVVDVHNFDLVLSQLCPQEVGIVYCRLGWLNLFNPLKIAGGYEFNLSVLEERLTCKAIILSAMEENGDNITNGKFQWERKEAVQAGWMITDSWLKDTTMPNKGFVSFYYKPTVGGEQHWVEAIYPLQRGLLGVVLIDERELKPDEHLSNNAPELTDGDVFISKHINDWAAYLYPNPSPAAVSAAVSHSTTTTTAVAGGATAVTIKKK